MLFDHINRLVLPLVVANIVHMIAIKRAWLAALAVPVSTGLFGANKTWRGFLLLPLFNAIALPLFSPSAPVGESLALGATLGAVYLLFELPNSYLKRRMGIGAGESPDANRALYAVLDKTDSALGVSLAYWILAEVSAVEALALFLVAASAHALFSALLVSLGIKRSF